MEIETNPLYQQYITAVRLLEKFFINTKTIHNDSDLGDSIRKLCIENECLMPFIKDQNFSQQPVTKDVVDVAMKEVAQDVRGPFVVRKGIVKKPKNKNTGLTREGFDKW